MASSLNAVACLPNECECKGNDDNEANERLPLLAIAHDKKSRASKPPRCASGVGFLFCFERVLNGMPP